MNTYTIQLFDLSTNNPTTLIKHESFHIWESKITGYFLPKNKDYITVNREGVNVYNIGT